MSRTRLSIGFALFIMLVPTPLLAAQLFSNAEVWFRADAGVLNPLSFPAGNGDAVATWEDQIGSLDVTQTTGTFQPTFVQTSILNGQPALEFDIAGADRMFNTTNLPTGGRTVLMAGDGNNAGDGGTTFAYRRSTSGGLLIHSNALSNLGGTFYVYSDGVNGANNTTGPSGTLTTIRSPFVSAHKSTPGNKIGVDLNGGALALSQPGAVAAETSSSPGFTVGGREDVAGFNWEGLIGEVLVYSRILNAAEMTISTNYLASKYDTASLGTTDKYQGDTIGNDNYDFNVFGIGRAAADTNGSAAGVVSTGMAGNGLILSELNSSLDVNGDFLMAGDKNVVNSLTTANAPAGALRWNRVWYVDNEGLAEARLTFDYAAAGLTFPTGDLTFGLLYASSSALNFSLLNVPASISGQQVSFDLSSIDLQDGFFTLAELPVPEPATLPLLSAGLVGLVANRRRRRAGRRHGR